MTIATSCTASVITSVMLFCFVIIGYDIVILTGDVIDTIIKSSSLLLFILFKLVDHHRMPPPVPARPENTKSTKGELKIATNPSK